MADVSSSFLRNGSGDVAIVFDDPTFVRAEIVLLDRSRGAVHALLHERLHLIGEVSRDMADMMCQKSDVLLSSVRPDGSVLDMRADLRLMN
jgi:hypothetical protein